jgi:hypothetical protein
MHRIGEGVCHKALNLARHGGTEQQRLAIWPDLSQNGPNLQVRRYSDRMWLCLSA